MMQIIGVSPQSASIDHHVITRLPQGPDVQTN